MRFLLLALLSTLCISCASTRKPAVTSVTIDEIKSRYIEQQDFMRISEYLSGKEYQGDRVILRTNSETRSGYYFTLILDQDARRLPAGTTVFGEFYTPKSLDVQEHTFTLPAKRPKSKEIFIGLTGEDWPVTNAIPGAWRFTIKDANGAILGSKQSYLWSL
jgi:hypothetical protein